MIRIIIDGADTILGRLASYAAKQALLGKEVIIVNCNDVCVAGRYNNIISEYLSVKKKGGSAIRGPFISTMPYKIVKRTVRGMLPYRKERGETALDRVICHNNTPKEFETVAKVKVDSISSKNKQVNTIKLAELSRVL